jgi:HlyD family secretion protein
MKKVIWVAAISAVMAVGYVALRSWKSTGKTEVRFETVRADRGSVVAKVTASGTLSALVTVQVGSQVSGRIKEMLVDFNDTVTKGQVIARIDPQLFNAAIEQARANFMAASADLNRAKVQAVDADRQYQRARSLAERKLVAQADLDTAQATAEVAQAQVEASASRVEQARAALHQAEVNLAYTTIASPIHGVVISRNVDVGQTVAASLQAPTLFVIAEDLRKMQVDTSVAEADVGKIQAEMKAAFTVDAFPSERFLGTVRQIRNSPQTVQNVVTYDAVIDVENPDLKLRPGMTANVTFIYAEKQNALRVPNAALRFRPSQELLGNAGEDKQSGKVRAPFGLGGFPPPMASANSRAPAPAPLDQPDRRTIWTLENGLPKSLLIKVGITDGSFTEVIGEELHENDLVIVDTKGGQATASSGGMGMRRGF